MMGKRLSLVLLMLSMLTGCQLSSSQQSVQAFDVANMEKVKNYDGLISHYKSRLVAGENDLAIKEKLAWAYFYKGDLESAAFYVQHLQEEGVENASLYQLSGQVFDAKDDTEQAISAYVASIAAGNETGLIYVLLGVSYTKAGKYNEAYQALNSARLRGYDDVAIKNNIAMIHMANNEYTQAIDILAPVLKEDPTNTVVKSNFAIALMKNQQVDLAKKLLKGEFSEQEIQSIAAELMRYRGE